MSEKAPIPPLSRLSKANYLAWEHYLHYDPNVQPPKEPLTEEEAAWFLRRPLTDKDKDCLRGNCCHDFGDLPSE